MVCYITNCGVANNFEYVDEKKAVTGGIWASINYLFADGLRAAGCMHEARRVAKGFCAAVKPRAVRMKGFR
ncbi:MAG: hypothetical protein JW384_03222 [Nitrosomonadaceae bacterium]|nr:hypothetical protein [Nitrosomonadaceae bacterium]